jgi:hypothetical protein
MQGFIIRSRGGDLYVEPGGGFHPSPANARLFPTRQEAEAFLDNRVKPPGAYEVCERAADGKETPVA